MRIKTTLINALLCLTCTFSLAQQNDCENIGFENGNFTGWKLEYGRVSNNAPSSIVTYTTPTLGTFQQGHLITSGTGRDPKITVETIPIVAPGSNFSARIGNSINGKYYDRISRTVRITADNSLLLYRFAIVLENPDPATHTRYQQPKFVVKILDQSGNSDDCNTYEVFASARNTGFKSQGTGTNLLVYRNWTTAALDLRPFLGQTVTISVTSSDCTVGGHYGYAYFDAQCLSSKISASADCRTRGITLSVPNGFESYRWSTGDTTNPIFIPNPIAGQRYSVTVKPFFSINDNCLLTFDYTIPIATNADTTVVIKRSCYPRDTGVVVQRLTNISGCDSLLLIKTTLNTLKDTNFIELTTCNPRDTGIVMSRFSGFLGCDSFVQQKTVLLRGRDTTFIPLTTCNPRDTGIVVSRLTNEVGCDSFISKKTVLLRGRDTTFIPLTTCNPRDTGIVVSRLTNAVGCDSFISKRTILLRGRDTNFLRLTSCNPRDTGIVVSRFTNAVGCDSFVSKKTVLLRGRDTTFITLTSCNPRDTGVVMSRLTNAVGCDSFISKRTILLRGRDTNYVRLTTCNPRDTGVFMSRFTNAVGCDSFVSKKTILLRGRDTTFLTAVVCRQSDTGIVVKRLTNLVGCDSFTQLKKEYYPITAEIIALPTNCTGESGTISIIKTTGSKTPYQYALQDTAAFQSSPQFSQLMGHYYSVFVKDAYKCVHRFDSIQVKMSHCDVFVPNVFSPNGDTHNDKFVVFASADFIKTIKSYRIYNRWGDLVYEAPMHDVPFNQFTDWWDGMSNGTLLTPDVFVYVIEVDYFDLTNPNVKRLLTGDVTLMR